MFGEGRAEEILVGAIAAVLAALLARRIFLALREDVIPIYRTRMARREAGDAKFYALVGINIALLALMVGIALDLLLGLGWR